ncbi:MAG TPA: pyridoxamine 5'-phosphate oxidase family protein [Polyangiaceae bacterium]|nr:pyridoxamine 5'-phosphate oxidase family protein [Polyangiaceae bacterium]
MAKAKTKTKTKRRAASSIPTPTPVPMVAGYRPPGTKQKFLAWSFAEQRLRRAHNYWVCTTRPDGRPHAAPVWGLWLDGAFLFSTEPSSRKARNLDANPNIVVHVESGDEVVMLEGRVETTELTPAIDATYFRKYEIHLNGFPAPMVLYRIVPKTISAWREKAFSASTTQWRF